MFWNKNIFKNNLMSLCFQFQCPFLKNKMCPDKASFGHSISNVGHQHFWYSLSHDPLENQVDHGLERFGATATDQKQSHCAYNTQNKVYSTEVANRYIKK